MKIAVLSTNKNLYSTRRLVEEGLAREHDTQVINHKRCYMNITSHNPSPGLEGIDSATDKNIAGMIIEFIEKHAKAGKTRTRGRG